MSVEITIVCDGCSQIIAANGTAREGRRAIDAQGGLVALPGGKDYCVYCVTKGRHREEASS